MSNILPADQSTPVTRPEPLERRPDRRADVEQRPAPTRGSDQVEVSDVAYFLSRLRDMPDIRTDLVERIREEIANGTYETQERLDGAIDGLLEDLQ
ncbi:MAG: flagellar biosynthesis anti-sigma factor FlgM [Phycisphaerales bacterium]|nr:flagellar biosynthesis anti-sigma factor FlgM [Phycisphaerales bacterium]